MGWPVVGNVGAKRVGLSDLLELRPQKLPDLGVRHIGLVQHNCIYHLAQVVQIEGVADGGFGAASDEDKEGQFAVNKRCGQNSHDVTLDIRVLAFIQTINDDKACPLFPRALIAESGVGLQEGVNDKSLKLSFKGAAEYKGVALDGLSNIASSFEDR